MKTSSPGAVRPPLLVRRPALQRGMIIALLLMLLFGAVYSHAADDPASPIDSHAKLRRELETILIRNHTPGAGVAIVGRDGPEWIAGLGFADVATKCPVTPDTLFRIGSTSKGFVALSLLKLQEEGKLNLQDTLRSRAPDLAFNNPWESTDPVRLVHLLEHTSGWDDLRFRDYASDPAEELTLRAGLALSPGVRDSRWRPGTRFAYSNAGPAAAAYVVEQVTGQRFEDYVEQNWFRPLGMTTASYFGTPAVLSRLTKLYRADGRTPFPYWKINVRPSGAINASAREMANYVQFYLDRGAFGGTQLLPSTAIDRLERATSTYAAREGLNIGYGLGNYATVNRGWVFHGHNGGVLGGLTELAYLPEAGVGYVVMINSGSGAALADLSSALRHYVIRRRSLPPALPPVGRVPPELAREYEGCYEFISPRVQQFHFLMRFPGFSKIRFDATGLTWTPLNQAGHRLVAVNARQFRRAEDPVATFALIADRSEGTLIQSTAFGGGITLRRVPGWWVGVQLTLLAFAALFMITTVAFALAWMPRKLFGRLRGVPHLRVRLWPLLATLSLAAAAACSPFLGGLPEIARYGNLTPWSLAVFLLTLAFPILAFAGLLDAWRNREAAIAPAVWWHSFLASAMLSVVAGYLIYWGAAGLRTWA